MVTCWKAVKQNKVTPAPGCCGLSFQDDWYFASGGEVVKGR